MIFKVHCFPAEDAFQTLQLRLCHALPYIVFFRMNGKAFPVIMVFYGILQGIMFPSYVTFKIINRSPGTCRIFSAVQNQILYVICSQRLLHIILPHLPVGSCLRTFHIRPLCRFLPVRFLFNLFQIFSGFFPCCKGMYRSVTVTVIFLTDVIPYSKIIA